MLNFLILITKVHQGSSCSCCVGIVQSSDIKLHTAARWSVRHPVRCRRNGLDWPFSHCLLKHIKNSKINRHHSYCRVLLLSVFSARFCVRTNVNADAAVLWKMQNKPGSDWSWGRSLMSCSQSVLEGFRRCWRKRTELRSKSKTSKGLCVFFCFKETSLIELLLVRGLVKQTAETWMEQNKGFD